MDGLPNEALYDIRDALKGLLKGLGKIKRATGPPDLGLPTEQRCTAWRYAGAQAGPAPDRDPVWSKNSCSLTLVVFQEASEPFTTLNGALTLAAVAG